VLEAGLPDGKLAPLIRLQCVLHRAWRADPVRFAGWTESDAEKTLTLGELYEVSAVASLRKARAKMVALSGCDPYQLGALEVSICANPGWTSARSGRGAGARSDAQTVRVRWPKFAEVMNLRGPGMRGSGSAAPPYEGQRTKNKEPRSGLASMGALVNEVVADLERRAPPFGRPPVAEGKEAVQGQSPAPLTDEDRAEMKRAREALSEKLRRTSHKP
jgi:hypothetical protein